MPATSSSRARAVGVIADQVVWSANSLLAGVLAARALPVDGFASFSAGLVLLLLALGLGRALFGQPLILRWSSASVREVRAATGSGLPAVLVYGLLWAAASALVLPVLGHRQDAAWVAPALVPVVLQDFLRLAGLARNAVGTVLKMDLIWFATQTGGLLAVQATGGLTVARAWQVMAAALCLSLFVGLVSLRPTRQPRAGVRSAPGSWRLPATLGGDFAVSTGLVLLLTSVLPLVAGAASLAALRGAQTVAGPLQVLQSGVDGALLPEASRRSHRRWADGVGLCVLVAAAAGLLALAMTAALLLLPSAVGVRLLGDTWPVAVPLLLPVLLRSSLAVVAMAAVVALRSTGAATSAFRLRVVTVPLLVAAAGVGALLGSGAGFAWGLTAAQAVSTVLWWLAVAYTRPSTTGRHAATGIAAVGPPRVAATAGARR